MPYQTQKSAQQNIKRNRRPIDIHQNNFEKGYISTFANSRRPQDSVSDATNMELTQDNIWRPRPSLGRYGVQPTNVVIGRGKYRFNGVRGQLFLMNVGGVGKWYYQVNGGAFTLIGGVNSYDITGNYANTVQSKNRVYIFNGKNNLSYIDLNTFATVEYTAITTPAAPSGTASAALISGTKPYNFYYKIVANNAVGKSAASVSSAAININDIRDNWSTATSKTVTVTWTAVTGATSYTLYGSDDINQPFYEIITLSNLATLSYTDDGSLTLNPFSTAPSSNSTAGAVFNWMYVDAKNATVYGVSVDNQLYYSGFGTGDFSALNGGGSVVIDDGGDTLLNFVDGFRTGKGDPVVTTSSRGAAGKGGLKHLTFQTATYGDQVISYPDITEANGQAGTYAPRATIKLGDDLIYPTGDNIKKTGTSQNVVNILTTERLGDLIIPDINKINLANLYKAAGVESQGKAYFCLPVGSTENNEIWILDTTRKNAWILRWTIAAKDIWQYEDSTGTTHLCILRADNLIMEFTRSGTIAHTDDGIAFQSRLAYNSLVWDEDGVSLGKVKNMFAKLLEPTGAVTFSTYGLSKRGATSNTGYATYSVEVSFTGIGQWDYSGDYQYGDDVGMVSSVAQAIAVLRIRPKGLLAQLDWELVAQTAGTDYYASAVNTRGVANIDLVYQGITK